MSTTIPLACIVEYEVGLDPDSLTPARIEEISAQQSIFLCQWLFYLLRQAAVGASSDPLFKPQTFLPAIEAVSLVGEAISHAANEHVERLSRLQQQGSKQGKRRWAMNEFVGAGLVPTNSFDSYALSGTSELLRSPRRSLTRAVTAR
ncbi:MAG TPA: hypothetical protein VEZ40_04520 [Pyrinomonadaceae bacterium]|nr:hypothetical protein [Pyrinomonadaceae bacterium]